MKKCHFLQMVLVVVFCRVFTTYAASQWLPLGLDSHSVNCIAVDDMGNVIAGTHTGLFLNSNSIWYEIPQANGLSVQDIIVTGPDRIVLAIGNGSNSDGMYEGNVTIWGPPFYTLRLVGNMDKPTALTKTENSQLVYVGNSTGIRYSILDTAGEGYFGFNEIKIPSYSFGVEMPYCAALHAYSEENCLYAGGYDRSTLPGPSYLLWGQGDSLKKFMSLNISAMTEGVIDWGGVKLFVGTIDTGIFYRTPPMSMPLQKHSESPNNEKVNDIIILPMAIGGGLMCVAVESGVYCQVGLEWRELGDIPAAPTSLAIKHSDTGFVYTLNAGTSEGVFSVNLSSVAVKKKEEFLSGNSICVTHNNTNDLINISFSITKPERIAVDILDVSGRTVARLAGRYYAAGKNALTIPLKNGRNTTLSNGVYVIKMVVGNSALGKRIVITK